MNRVSDIPNVSPRIEDSDHGDQVAKASKPGLVLPPIERNPR